MEMILRSIYEEYEKNPNTLGVLLIEKRDRSISTTDTFDATILIIVNSGEQPVFVKHYCIQEKKASLHIVSEEKMREWMLLGTNRKIIDWLYNGKILFDRNEYITNLRKELKDFPLEVRKVKMGLEFAKLIRRYKDGKAFFENGHYYDAYNHVIHSLHHLARLSIIEKGLHPEVTVWNQVKKIEPEVYKLYAELVMSDEPLDKRLQLLFLASEFLIHARTESGSTHLLSILREKEFWTFDDIMNHHELKIYSVDLQILIEYLIERGKIDVKKAKTNEDHIFNRYYMALKNV